jgi:plasmid stabilization system protein ParE
VTFPVRFTPAADAEFLAVVAHIGADSPSAAVALKGVDLGAYESNRTRNH